MIVLDLSYSLSTILSEGGSVQEKPVSNAPVMQSTPVLRSKPIIQKPNTLVHTNPDKPRRKFPGPAGTLPKLVRDIHS